MGAVFFEAEGTPDAAENVEAMEKLLIKVQDWLEGSPVSWNE